MSIVVDNSTGWSDALGAWIGIAAGIAGAVATLYGSYQTWQNRRREQARRLGEAAAIAVRKVDAAYVRPLLRQKLEGVVRAFLEERRENDSRFRLEDPGHARMLLFVRLQDGVALSDTEKEVAHRTAVTNLIAALRTMPSPPLRLRDDETHAGGGRHEGRLRELVEGAYHIKNRASADIIQAFQQFCPSRDNFLHHGPSGAAPDPPVCVY